MASMDATVHLLPQRCGAFQLSKSKLERLLSLEQKHLLGVREIEFEVRSCTPPTVGVRLAQDAQEDLRFELKVDPRIAHRQLVGHIVEEIERAALLSMAPMRKPRPTRFGVGASLVFVGAAKAALAGPGVSLSWHPSSSLAVVTDVRYVLRRRAEALGSVHIDIVTAGAHVGWRWGGPDFHLSVGPEIIAGYGRIRGRAEAETTLERSQGGPVFLAGFRVGIAWAFYERLVLFASASFDGVVAGLSANVDGAEVFDLSGPAGAGAAGLRLRF